MWCFHFHLLLLDVSLKQTLKLKPFKPVGFVDVSYSNMSALMNEPWVGKLVLVCSCHCWNSFTCGEALLSRSTLSLCRCMFLLPCSLFSVINERGAWFHPLTWRLKPITTELSFKSHFSWVEVWLRLESWRLFDRFSAKELGPILWRGDCVVDHFPKWSSRQFFKKYRYATCQLAHVVDTCRILGGNFSLLQPRLSPSSGLWVMTCDLSRPSDHMV